MATLVGHHDVQYGVLVQGRICEAAPYEDPMYQVSLVVLSYGGSS